MKNEHLTQDDLNEILKEAGLPPYQYKKREPTRNGWLTNEEINELLDYFKNPPEDVILDQTSHTPSPQNITINREYSKQKVLSLARHRAKNESTVDHCFGDPALEIARKLCDKKKAVAYEQNPMRRKVLYEEYKIMLYQAPLKAFIKAMRQPVESDFIEGLSYIDILALIFLRVAKGKIRHLKLEPDQLKKAFYYVEGVANSIAAGELLRQMKACEQSRITDYRRSRWGIKVGEYRSVTPRVVYWAFKTTHTHVKTIIRQKENKGLKCKKLHKLLEKIESEVMMVEPFVEQQRKRIEKGFERTNQETWFVECYEYSPITDIFPEINNFLIFSLKIASKISKRGLKQALGEHFEPFSARLGPLKRFV